MTTHEVADKSWDVLKIVGAIGTLIALIVGALMGGIHYTNTQAVELRTEMLTMKTEIREAMERADDRIEAQHESDFKEVNRKLDKILELMTDPPRNTHGR